MHLVTLCDIDKVCTDLKDLKHTPYRLGICNVFVTVQRLSEHHQFDVSTAPDIHQLGLVRPLPMMLNHVIQTKQRFPLIFEREIGAEQVQKISLKQVRQSVPIGNLCQSPQFRHSLGSGPIRIDHGLHPLFRSEQIVESVRSTGLADTIDAVVATVPSQQGALSQTEQ